jgi:hypothetical protein
MIFFQWRTMARNGAKGGRAEACAINYFWPLKGAKVMAQTRLRRVSAQTKAVNGAMAQWRTSPSVLSADNHETGRRQP